VTVDSVKAARLGITAQQIGDAVNVSTVGDNDARLAQFNDRSRQIPIRVRLPAAGHDLGVLENLKLATPTGTSVPLSSVATIRFGMGPTTIERYDRQRRINLEANLNGVALGTAVEQINFPLPSTSHPGPAVQGLAAAAHAWPLPFPSAALRALFSHAQRKFACPP
jgi:HAE1 family hydrophobic/amphiphilic exporter-1